MADIGARNERRRGGTPAPAVLFPSADGIRKQFKGTKVRSVWEALVVGPARSMPFLLVPKPYPRAEAAASAALLMGLSARARERRSATMETAAAEMATKTTFHSRALSWGGDSGAGDEGER